MKKLRKFTVVVAGAAMIFGLTQLSSCTEDSSSSSSSEYVTCDGTCDSSNPYSNQYSNSCYSSLSDCESSTGHSCKNCN